MEERRPIRGGIDKRAEKIKKGVMRIIELKTESGEFLTYMDLPESASEIPLNRYVDFISIFKGIFDDEAQNNPIELMAKAIGAVCNIDLTTLFQAKLGSEYLRDKDMYDSLYGCFGYLKNIFENANGRLRQEHDFTFQYAGNTHEIPLVKTVALTVGEVLPGVSVGQAVEALEIIRMTETQEKKQGDPEGNLMFGLYLRMLAILAPIKGESMPEQGSERRAWIDDRASHFKYIDAQTALDIDFFLTIILLHLGKTHPIAGSLSLPLIGTGAVTKKLKWSRTKGRKSTRRMSLKK